VHTQTIGIITTDRDPPVAACARVHGERDPPQSEFNFGSAKFEPA
jgi:hypothetical protein